MTIFLSTILTLDFAWADYDWPIWPPEGRKKGWPSGWPKQRQKLVQFSIKHDTSTQELLYIKMIDSFFLLFFCFCPSIYFSDSTEPSNRIPHWETSHLKFNVQIFESSTSLFPECNEELKCFHKARMR